MSSRYKLADLFSGKTIQLFMVKTLMQIAKDGKELKKGLYKNTVAEDDQGQEKLYDHISLDTLTQEQKYDEKLEETYIRFCSGLGIWCTAQIHLGYYKHERVEKVLKRAICAYTGKEVVCKPRQEDLQDLSVVLLKNIFKNCEDAVTALNAGKIHIIMEGDITDKDESFLAFQEALENLQKMISLLHYLYIEADQTTKEQLVKIPVVTYGQIVTIIEESDKTVNNVESTIVGFNNTIVC